MKPSVLIARSVVVLVVVSGAGCASWFVSLDGFADGVVASPDAGAADRVLGADDARSPAVDDVGAGSGGDASEERTTLSTTCPRTAGPVGVRVTAGAVSFCIDATEVSRAQYLAFLATSPSVSAQPAECTWNRSFAPSNDWPPAPGAVNLPVTWVDWCDAKAFCAWAGKRLCGAVGGERTGDLAVAHDAFESEWLFACTKGSTRSYPYGVAYDPNACVGSDKGIEGMVDVGSVASCSGGFEGIYDLSGNAHEWMDSCGPPVGGPETAHCSFSRSAWHVAASDMGCHGIDATRPRYFQESDIGFRCCSD